MRNLLIVLLLILLLGGLSSAQTVKVALRDVKQVKLLVSNRGDVRKIFANYNTTFDDEDRYQRFSNDEVDIEVTYASGICGEDPNYEEYEDLWSVDEWKVVRIEIEPTNTIDLADIGFDLSKFTKQQRHEAEPESVIFHDKSAGVAFQSDEDGVNKIFLFPASANKKRLCDNNDLIKEFYAKSSWYPESEFEPPVCILVNNFANVVDLALSLDEISGTTGKSISVSTKAIDAENDVLTYVYTISGGKIIGRGSQVAWDLNGVPPGIYSISVGVDDGNGVIGSTITKTVAVK